MMMVIDTQEYLDNQKCSVVYNISYYDTFQVRRSMAEGLRQEEYEALALFRYELRRFLRFSEEAARAVGIEPQQHQALLAVRGFAVDGCITIGELAERLQLRHHSVGGLVNRLEAQGMLERVQGTDDRRQVFVQLTPQGQALLDELTATHKVELQRLGPQLAALIQQVIGSATDVVE